MSRKQTTKERRIQSSSKIFEGKGFREETVAKICKNAGANIDDVNFHSVDKKKLHKAVWDYLYQATGQQLPVTDNPLEIGDEVWLRHFLRARLQRTMPKGPAGLYPKLIHRETTEITSQSENIFVTFLRPNRLRVRDAITDFMGKPISEEQLNVASLNFMGVHIPMNVGYQKHMQNPAIQKKFPAEINSEYLLNQFEACAIGGLKEVKNGLS